MGLVATLKALPAKYGIAWIIVIQILGWISYSIILACLLLEAVDAGAWLERWGFAPERVAMARSKGGALALGTCDGGGWRPVSFAHLPLVTMSRCVRAG